MLSVDEIRQLRADFAMWSGQLREYERDLNRIKRELRAELLESVNGDHKQLGATEQIRDDRYEDAYTADELCNKVRDGRDIAQQRVAELRAAIETLEDELRLERMRVEDRRTSALIQAIEAGIRVESIA